MQLRSWLVYMFCTKCLIILDDPTEVTKEIRTQFVKYICKKIFRFDMLLTKRAWFNMSLIFGTVDKTASQPSAVTKSTDEDETNPFDVSMFDMDNPDDEVLVIRD